MPRRRARPWSGSPSRSAPTRKVVSPRQVDLAERLAAARDERDPPARAARRTAATARARSSPPTHAAPSARSGRRSPSESATAAPKASAVRISVPTFPGSAMRQSASATGRGSGGGRSSRRKTPTTRGGCATVETSASRRGLDVLARDQQFDRLGRRGRDEVLALADEQPELVAPPPLVQLADELELLVVARRDHAAMPRRTLARQRRAPTWPARRACRTRPDRSPRGRPAPCGRARSRRLADPR